MSRRPRLWFVVESGTDGRLIDGLAERFDLVVLARRVADGVAVNHPFPSTDPPRLGPTSRLRFAAWAAAAIAREPDIDFLVLQNEGAAALACQIAARQRATPSALLVCSPAEAYYVCRRVAADPRRPYRAREHAVIRTLVRLNGRIAQRYVVLSEYLAHLARRRAPDVPVHVIPIYGVDTTVFRPSADRLRARAELGLGASGAWLFFSSRIAPEKDAATLLDALARLVAAGRDVRLLHRSGGYRELAREAARRGLNGRVAATDAVHPHRELPRSYVAADLCVQASRAEGLGFSALEALACETPVVAAAVGGLRETIVDGRTGWSYPAGDAAALAGAIAEALDRPEEAARRARAGRALVAERFERAAVFAAFERLVHDCLR
jgi:glycosyltransferase involved in cell wall biosynthesis